MTSELHRRIAGARLRASFRGLGPSRGSRCWKAPLRTLGGSRCKALKLISDSELLVRQIKGIYQVKNETLKDLHGRAKELIAQLDWFQIGHALREHNRDADRLANDAMDKGMGRRSAT